MHKVRPLRQLHQPPVCAWQMGRTCFAALHTLCPGRAFAFCEGVAGDTPCEEKTERLVAPASPGSKVSKGAASLPPFLLVFTSDLDLNLVFLWPLGPWRFSHNTVRDTTPNITEHAPACAIDIADTDKAESLQTAAAA
jgi:hypothetical protein